MDLLAGLARSGCIVINSPKSIETAVDKYLATYQLMNAGIDVPRTWVGQSAAEAMEGFTRLGGDVVLKPLFGSEGRGITRISDEEIAQRAFKTLEQLGAVIYLQEFIPHGGYDQRILVIGRHLFGMERRNISDWRTNISRGAKARPLAIDDSLAELAFNAAHAVGASMSGIDIVTGPGGTPLVLEVNAVPGWKALSRTVQTDIAAVVIEHVRGLVASNE
jgi:ribosomal protein S6--L-glutamate ligase